jgi:cysteine synthase A
MEEGAGRRGIPSLLKSPVPAEIEAASLQQEHIASDITQVRPSYLVSLSWAPGIGF